MEGCFCCIYTVIQGQVCMLEDLPRDITYSWVAALGRFVVSIYVAGCLPNFGCETNSS